MLFMMAAVLVPLVEDREPGLELFGGDNRLPAPPHRLSRDLGPVGIDHYPAGIEPVVESAREGLDVGDTTAIGLDQNERDAAA